MKKFNMRLWAMIALIALLAACSTVRFSYNHGDTLLYWWMNSYVDLDREQANEAKRDIAAYFQWHRHTQLKDYIALLQNGQKQLAGPMTTADLIKDFDEIKLRTQTLILKAAPDLAEFAMTMRPEQIAAMEKKFNSNNEDYRRKFLRVDLEKRQKLRYKASLDQLETWFGSFTREQEAAIRIASDARPLDNTVWLAERQRRQTNTLAAIHKIQHDKLNKADASALIENLVRESFERMDAPEHKAFFDAYTESTANMVLVAIKLATPAQKAHAHKRMQGWIEDFQALAAEGTRPVL